MPSSAAQTELPNARTIAVGLSTMRSGSTLLKALLAAAPDISHLPEVDFQKYRGVDAREAIEALSDQRIIVLKRPSWFNEMESYPKLPRVDDLKRIVLTRDAHTNVLSVRKMLFRGAEPYIPAFVDRWIAEFYWARTYENLLERFPKSDSSNFWVRYEDLASDPVTWTEKLYSFLGSEQTEGVESYRKPQNYDWKWGKDDGGEKIKSLKAQAPKAIPSQAFDILNRIRNLPTTRAIRAALGYA